LKLFRMLELVAISLFKQRQTHSKHLYQLKLKSFDAVKTRKDLGST